MGRWGLVGGGVRIPLPGQQGREDEAAAGRSAFRDHV